MNTLRGGHTGGRQQAQQNHEKRSKINLTMHRIFSLAPSWTRVFWDFFHKADSCPCTGGGGTRGLVLNVRSLSILGSTAGRAGLGSYPIEMSVAPKLIRSANHPEQIYSKKTDLASKSGLSRLVSLPASRAGRDNSNVSWLDVNINLLILLKFIRRYDRGKVVCFVVAGLGPQLYANVPGMQLRGTMKYCIQRSPQQRPIFDDDLFIDSPFDGGALQFFIEELIQEPVLLVLGMRFKNVGGEQQAARCVLQRRKRARPDFRQLSGGFGYLGPGSVPYAPGVSRRMQRAQGSRNGDYLRRVSAGLQKQVHGQRIFFAQVLLPVPPESFQQGHSKRPVIPVNALFSPAFV